MPEHVESDEYQSEINKLKNYLKLTDEEKEPSEQIREMQELKSVLTLMETGMGSSPGESSEVGIDIPSPAFSMPEMPFRMQQEASEDVSASAVASGPVGLDIGTTNIVMAQHKGAAVTFTEHLNAWFSIPRSKFTRQILMKNEIPFFEHNDMFYIIGNSAENFANLFNADTRRPMEKGLLSFRTEDGFPVIQSIIKTLIGNPKNFGETICFSIPGPVINAEQGTSTVDAHESIFTMYLESLGYTPVAINEGLAVVMAELADENYTGIGISMGGGMCNVCLSYLSVPVITYSIQKGGDYIDQKVGSIMKEPATKIKGIKEEGLDLVSMPKNKAELALQAYYLEVIHYLVMSMQDMIASSDRMPKISQSIPIVIGGGTAKVKGFRDRFETALKSIRLPIGISSIRISDDPLHTTARGALAMALLESE